MEGRKEGMKEGRKGGEGRGGREEGRKEEKKFEAINLHRPVFISALPQVPITLSPVTSDHWICPPDQPPLTF